MRNFITNKETKKDTAIPKISSKISLLLALNPSKRNLIILRPDAPSIIGIAIKNENSALASLDTPERIPPKIVEPERDVPGIRESV